ncbi:LacI family DNA-binding transcriptional regulator [Nitratireductor sp. XY-223]|uniref:LacI family DNA-binding transcriptional regulator n=1 Tax=Nitratireductor sp. XY-223 TaxID=2561926 RepID=UPI002484BD5C|nr:LacI family DNA-binding transcriptional regulator [Nitratireductor sp. XY-223]
MAKGQKRLTQRDVARSIGMSDMTVSRVLAGRGVVNSKTREKVLKAVAELGYVPNRLAGSLASARSNQVGVVLPSITVGIFPDVAAGIAAELEKAGYNPVIGITDYDPDREERLIESMLSWNAAGMIVNDFVHTRRAARLLSVSPAPVVEIMQVAGDPIDHCVGFNHFEAGAEMVRHLISRGYRRFGFLGWHGMEFAASARYEGIRTVLSQAGFELFAPSWYNAPPGIQDGTQGLSKLRAARPDIDVVIFGNDLMAAGGYLLSMKMGWQVPGDIAIAGFGGMEIGQSLSQKLTTIDFPRQSVGRTAARTVLNLLVGQSMPRVREFPFDLVVGETT